MAGAQSPAPVCAHMWRMRAAIIVDVVVGLATVPALLVVGLQLSALLSSAYVYAGLHYAPWMELVQSLVPCVVYAAAATLLARLALQGRTPGLALMGLRWAGADGRAAWQRLLGEPQAWCAALPVVWGGLVLPTKTVLWLVGDGRLWTVSSTIDTVIGLALVLGSLGCMVVLRWRPGRLVSRA